MNLDNFWYAFGLTCFAGFSTSIGSLIALLAKKTSRKFLSVSLGFSAGVMIYVSLVEIFVKAKESLVIALGPQLGHWATIGGFFGGVAVIALIDFLVPGAENPHEIRSVDDHKMMDKVARKKFLRMGLFIGAAIFIHNFPEGLATFMAALQRPELGIPIAVAIAIHNIPEGISVSIPIYQATGSRKKAFIYSSLSGLAEPLGALIGFFIVKSFMNDVVFGMIFSSVAGIMVYISLDELLPAAQEYGEHHWSIWGLVMGMAVMAVSLVLLV